MFRVVLLLPVNSVKLLFSAVVRGGLCTSDADVVPGGVHHRYEDTTMLQLCRCARMHRNLLFLKSCQNLLVQSVQTRYFYLSITDGGSSTAVEIAIIMAYLW